MLFQILELLFGYGVLSCVAQQTSLSCLQPRCQPAVQLRYLPVVNGETGLPTLNTTIVTAPIGSRVYLDCQMAEGCIKDENLCEYQILWHRLAGCNSSYIPPNGNATPRRLLTQGRNNAQLQITNAQSHDSGLWVCELRTKLKSTQNVQQILQVEDSTILVAGYMLHIGSAEDRGMIQCVSSDNALTTCETGEICASQALSVKSGPNHSITQPPQPFGCVHVHMLPTEVIRVLIGPSAEVCAMRQNAESCEATRINLPGAATTLALNDISSQCCYCFTSNCNRRTIDVARNSWSGPENQGETCAQLAGSQRQYLEKIGRSSGERFQDVTSETYKVASEQIEAQSLGSKSYSMFYVLIICFSLCLLSL